MSVIKIYSVFDSAVKTYNRPFFAETDGAALRTFRMAINDPASPFYASAADFTLYSLGQFDQDTGLFDTGAPDNMGNGLTFKDQEIEALMLRHVPAITNQE